MSIYNFPSASTTLVLADPQSAAATVTGTGIDLQPYDGPILILQAGGVGTGTLDGKIQDSADNTTFADVSGAVFAQKTTTAGTQALVINTASVRRYIRYVGTVVTGPQLLAVTATGFRKLI